MSDVRSLGRIIAPGVWRTVEPPAVGLDEGTPRGGAPPDELTTAWRAAVPAAVVVIDAALIAAPDTPVRNLGMYLLPVAAVSLAILGFQARSIRRGRALHRRLRERGGGWRGDHPWPATGEEDAAPSRIRRALGASRLLPDATILLCGGYAAAVATRHAAWLLVGVLALVVELAVRALRVGSMAGLRVTYVDLPARPDGPIVVRVGLSDAGAGPDRLQVAVRCVAEAPRVLGAPWTWVAGRPALRAVRFEEVHLLASSHTLPTPGSDVDLVIHPPPGLPGTRLAAEFPTYWEVDVQASIGRTVVTRRFLLPVYAEASEPAEASQ